MTKIRVRTVPADRYLSIHVHTDSGAALAQGGVGVL